MMYGGDNTTDVTAACDATWGSCVTTRKSTGGWLLKMAGGTIAWRSYKIKSIATSSMHAELMALQDCAKQCVWMLKVLKELRMPQSTITIKCDSQSTIKWLANPTPTGKAKHYDIAYWWVAEQVQHGRIHVVYINTSLNTADTLTKALPGPAFKKHQEVVVGTDPIPSQPHDGGVNT